MRVPLLLFAALSPCFGIIINDPNVSGFATGNSAFTGVAAIHFTGAGNTPNLCSGALISTDLILTAGHCVSGASNWQVTFSTPTSSATIAATAGYLHPLYASRPSPLNGIPQYDVALLRLSSNAPTDASVYGLQTTFTGITTATQMDLVGFGLYGTDGQTPALNFYNPVRHWARNTIDGVAVTYDGVATPDYPLILTTNFNQSTPANEGLVNGGDSGGPLLYGNYIIGVASAADLPRSSAVLNNTTYSNIYASIADDTTGDWVESYLVPEPGSIFLAAAGFVALFTRRHLKRREPISKRAEGQAD